MQNMCFGAPRTLVDSTSSDLYCSWLTMNKSIVHLVSRQIGCAYPIVEFGRIFERVGYQVRGFAYQASRSVFEASPFRWLPIETYDDYLAKRTEAPQLLFTGTSVECADDSKYWIEAKGKKIPSIAWLDQSMHIEKRFPASLNAEAWPDLVLTTDSGALTDALGTRPPVPFECVGSPYLQKYQRELVRRPSETLYFASEPSVASYREVHGLDQFDSLAVALTLLGEMNVLENAKRQLTIKLHPIEKREAFERQLADRGLDINLPTYTDITKDELLQTASSVWGMRSMLLYEAGALGIPVLSFQPNRKTASTFTDRNRNILTFTSPTADVNAARSFLNQKIEPLPQIFEEQRFLAIVKELMVGSNPTRGTI